jgi:hypothetical protein
MGSMPRGTVACAIRGPIARDDIRGLCTRIHRVVEEAKADAVICDVTNASPDVVTVEVLALLQLTAHRHGYRIWLGGASSDLLDLITFLGLEEVMRE